MKLLPAAFIAACAMECSALTKITCIGNSITYGYGLSNQATQSYPGRLQALLGTANYTVQNDGVNSTTMTKKGDIPYWKSGMLAQVFTFQPAIITIKLGTNDTKPWNWDSLGYGSQYKTDCLAMVDTLAAMASHPKIFLILPVPVFANAVAVSWGIRDSVIQKEMPIIRQVAAARSLTVIDANTPLKNFPQYFSVDGVHPDARGEDTIAHVVYRAIAATAAREPPFLRSTPPAARKNTGLVVSASGANSSVIGLFDIAGKRLNNCTVSGCMGHRLNAASLSPGAYIVRAAGGF